MSDYNVDAPIIRTCGAYVRGLRCGSVIHSDRFGVCFECAKGAFNDLYRDLNGKQYLTEFLAQLAVSDRVTQIRRETEQRKSDEAAERAAAKEADRQSETGYVVYYARLGHNHIKIGTTNRLPQRMTELRVVNASNLLAAEPGGYTLEHERHVQFRKWRYNKRKEDFGEGQDLLDHITGVRQEHGDPYTLAARLLA